MSKSPITIRVDTKLLAAARQQASVENRTLTNYIETLLKRALVGNPEPASTIEAIQPLPPDTTSQLIQIPAAISSLTEAPVEAKEA